MLASTENDGQLRDYQLQNKEEIYRAWKQYRSVMLQMPTGTGKTHLFASIVKDIHNKSVEDRTAYKVLILVHRQELVDQIAYTLGVKYNVAHGIIMAGTRQQNFFPTQVASVQTLNRRLENWIDTDFSYIIIDEAHHALAETYKQIIKTFSDAKILGVTATPFRLSGDSFRRIFQHLIVSPRVSYFIENGYLSQYDYYSIAPTSEIQKAIENINKFDIDGDYAIEAMSKIIDTKYVEANILKAYKTYAFGKKGIVYTINQRHNNHVCKAYCDAGFIAKAIDSKTDKELRNKVIQEFRSGKIDILCNVNIFSEGFDCPDIEFIQLARPTTSLSLYLQQVGRGLRKHPDLDKVIFLDNVGSYNKFGLPSSYRNWHRYFNGFKKADYEKLRLNEDDENYSRYCSVYRLEDGVEIIEGNKSLVRIITTGDNEGPENLKKTGLSQFDVVEDFFIPPNYKQDSIFNIYLNYNEWVDNVLNEIDVEDSTENKPEFIYDRLRKVQKLGLWGLYDTVEEKMILNTEYLNIEGPSNFGMSIIEKNGEFGVFCVKELTLKIPCEYQEIIPVESFDRRNQFIASKHNSYGLIDEFNNTLIPFTLYDLFAIYPLIWNQTCILIGELSDKYVLINTNNTIIDTFKVKDKLISYSKLVIDLQINSKSTTYFGIGNADGNLLFPALFNELKLQNNLILGRSIFNKFGIFDKNLTYILSFSYSEIQYYNNKFFIACARGASKILNSNGKVLMDTNFNDIKIKNGIICVKIDRYWQIIDINNQVLATGNKLNELLNEFKVSSTYINKEYVGLEPQKNDTTNGSKKAKPKNSKSNIKPESIAIITTKPQVNNEVIKNNTSKKNKKQKQKNENQMFLNPITNDQEPQRKKRPRIRVKIDRKEEINFHPHVNLTTIKHEQNDKQTNWEEQFSDSEIINSNLKKDAKGLESVKTDQNRPLNDVKYSRAEKNAIKRMQRVKQVKIELGIIEGASKKSQKRKRPMNK